MKTTRKLTKTLLTLALLLVLAPALAGNARAAWEGSGSGTEADPYQIGAAAELKKFRDIVNGANGETTNSDACAVLTADIDLENAAWTPIGNGSNVFKGTFDGQGHSITNLNVPEDSSLQYAGLFGRLYSGGTVKNLSVTGNVAAKCEGTSGSAVAGGIVGKNEGGTVQYCRYSGSVTANSSVNQGSAIAGGIVGNNISGGTVQNCCSDGAVSATHSNGYLARAGGVAGFNGGTLQYCFHSSGSVTGSNGTSTNVYLGGVAGASNNTVTSCYFLDGPSNSLGTQLTAEQFADTENFPGWDFENTWYMGENGPVLRAKEPMPAAAFAAAGAAVGTLSSVTTAMKYSVNGGTSWAAITGTTMSITGVTTAYGVKVYLPATDANTKLDSDAQSITVTQAATPSLYVTQPTTFSGTGSVATDSTHEYSADGTSWTACTGTLTGLAQGSTRYVRVKASGTVLASGNQTVTINTFTGTKEPTPTTASFAATGYDTGTLSGVTSGMKYSTDGTSWTDIADSADIALTNLTAPCTISVKKTGNGSTTTDSDPQEISVTRAATPSLTVTQPTTIDGTGSVATDSTHEWSENGTSGWTACTGALTGLAQGSTRYVRVAASGTVLASANQTVTISTVTTYAVTVTNDGHGTGSASPASGASGTVVTLTASPNAGYHFKAWQVVSGGVSVAGNSFTIGTANVTVKALFEKDAPSVPSYDPDPTPPTYPPSVADAQNGTVTVSPKNPQAGDKVTITVTPDTGYQVESVTVTDAFGKNVTVKDSGDGTYAFTQPSGKVTIKVTFAPISAPTLTTAELLTRFSDLQPGAWYLEPVRYMVERGIMNGTDKGFEPNAATTQGMMEQILYNLDGNALVAPAEGEAWWTAADNWAGNGGVTDGVASHDPTAPATREVDILMMYNYARAKGYNVTARADLDQFSDAGSVSAGAREAMSWAVAMGIINGTVDAQGNVILDAQGTATRAQVAAIVQRFCENVAK